MSDSVIAGVLSKIEFRSQSKDLGEFRVFDRLDPGRLAQKKRDQSLATVRDSQHLYAQQQHIVAY